MKIRDKEEFLREDKFGVGEPNVAYSRCFTGSSFLKALTKKDASIHASNVTFEPGCRNFYHIHHATKGGGQLLICTAGEGWYREYGKEAISLKEGMVIYIPANVKHFHGAKKDSYFSHIAIEIPGENCFTEWCEPVLDQEYNALGKEN